MTNANRAVVVSSRADIARSTTVGDCVARYGAMLSWSHSTSAGGDVASRNAIPRSHHFDTSCLSDGCIGLP
jgi:hypothetical protein